MTTRDTERTRPGARPADDPIVEICTTHADRTAADACAAMLVAERLAACVQVDGPVQATYRWQAAIETSTEWRCVCKTTASRAAACRAAIVRTHAYRTPEILQMTVLASPDYAAWVRESVAAAEPPAVPGT
jgi:periplasmic divalent cation tolerance protein